MNGFRYPATSEERVAAALLRSKGWNVQEPTCPECHGLGHVNRFEAVPPGDEMRMSTMRLEPCPNQCPYPVMIL